MWSSVNSSDRLSGVSLARDSSDTVTPPSVAFGDVHDRDASFLIVDVTHPTPGCRTSRAIDLHKGSPTLRRSVALSHGAPKHIAAAESRMKDPPVTFASAVASRTVAVCSVLSFPNVARRRLTLRGGEPLARIVHGR